MSSETVGFIGLGHMGEGMARRLLHTAGRKLIVWNRSDGKSKALEAEGKGAVTVAASPAAVVRACTVTYVMLSEPNAVRSVYEMDDGVLAGISAGKKLVDCATLAVEDMERLSAQVLAKGGRFLEAPVSGSKAPAAQGQLIFLAAGDEGLYVERAADFDAMGKAKFYFGAIGGGTRVKLAVNMVMGTMLASLGEGLALTSAAGIAPKLLLEVLDLGAMACPLFKLKGPKMLASDCTPPPADQERGCRRAPRHPPRLRLCCALRAARLHGLRGSRTVDAQTCPPSRSSTPRRTSSSPSASASRIASGCPSRRRPTP